MSLSSQVTQSHIFGFKTDVKNNVHFLNDNNIIYCAGAVLVIYNVEQKTQKFLAINEGEVTCMAVAPGATHVALGVRASTITTNSVPSNFNASVNIGTTTTPESDTQTSSSLGQPTQERLKESKNTQVLPVVEKPRIIIIDLRSLKKKRNITASDINAREFVDMQFSNDGKYLLAQSSDPEWNLYMINWEKAKIVAATKVVNLPNTTVHQLQVNPYDLNSFQVSLVGNGLFKILRYSEGQFKTLNQFKLDKNCLCHCWANDQRIIIGTEDSKLLIFESSELVLEVQYVVKKGAPSSLSMSGQPSIQSLFACSTGLVIGTSHGAVAFYEKTDDMYMYRKGKEVALDKHSVRHLTLSPSEDSAIVSLANNQMFSLVMADLESSKEALKCERLGHQYHHGAVTGMDLCIRKPILATCSADRSVRLWNYIENSGEVVMYFTDEPLSIALHPSGLYILVSFPECLRMMTVLLDELRPFWEGPIRGSREMKFSSGGQYFACVQGSQIYIVSTWTFESLCVLKGHSGNVRGLCWSADDNRLLSCAMDGAVIEWNIRKQKKNWECNLKTVVQCVTYAPDSRMVYAVGSDGCIREIVDGTVTKEISNQGGLTQVAISHNAKYMLVTNIRGVVRVYKYPLTPPETSGATANNNNSEAPAANPNTTAKDSSQPGPSGPKISITAGQSGSPVTQDASASKEPNYETADLQSHDSTITKIRVSFDDQYFFTASEDGSFWSYKLANYDKRKDKDFSYSDEILVTKSGLKTHVKQISDLRQKVEDLRLENESQLRSKDTTYSEKLREVTNKYMNEIDNLKDLINGLTREKTNNDVQHRASMGEARANGRAEIDDLISTFNRKVNAESEKYSELKRRMEEVGKQWEAQMASMQAEHTSRVSDIRAFYESKMKEKQEEIARIRGEMGKHKGEFGTYISEVEEDVDREILEIMQSYETKLKEERDSLVSIKEENQSMRSRFESLNREIDQHKAELSKLSHEEKKLKNVIRTLEKDILGVKREMLEREETMQDKEKRIYDLKKKNQELEKFKFVLDYKIKELKRQVEPRQKDIHVLTHKIDAMDHELHDYHHHADGLRRQIQDLNMKLLAQEKEARMERSRSKQVKLAIHKIQMDLDKLWKETADADIAIIKPRIIELYHAYCGTKQSNCNGGRGEVCDDSVIAFEREKDNVELEHRQHLQRTIKTLERKANEEQKKRTMNNGKLMTEQAALLSEINHLRRQVLFQRTGSPTRVQNKVAQTQNNNEFVGNLA